MINGLGFIKQDLDHVLRLDKELAAFDKKKIDTIESGIIISLQRNLRDDSAVLDAKLDDLLLSITALAEMVSMAESAVFITAPGTEHLSGWELICREFFTQTGAKIAVRVADGKRFTQGMMKDTPPDQSIGLAFYKAGDHPGIYAVDSKAGMISGPHYIPETRSK